MNTAFRSLPLFPLLHVLLLPVTVQCAFAHSEPIKQEGKHKLPVIKANSPTVDIRDGEHLLKGAWNISPEVPLDIYYAKRSQKKKRVTFRTDRDSISFDVEPGKSCDFDILLNDKQLCHTRISTLRRSARRIDPQQTISTDEIPFTLEKDGKIHIVGKINGSKDLDLIFDTGADTIVVFPSALAKELKMEFDGVTNNVGFGGASTRKTSSDNKLALANLQWDHESVLYIEKQSDVADGIIGFNVFEDKVVEIDYDHQRLIIQDALPKTIGRFTKIPTRMQGALPMIPVTLSTKDTTVTGWFTFDTGSDSSLHLNATFSEANKLYGTMKKIGTSRSGGVGEGVIDNDTVLLPVLTIAGMETRDIAIDQEMPSDNSFLSESIVGMEVLKRFNTILDYRKNTIYLKKRAETPLHP